MQKVKKPEIISIIGGKGKLGNKFKKAFEKAGLKVVVADLKSKISNREAAEQGDVVIVSVPIRETEKVIREILPFLKKDALLTDFTSVKMKLMQLMMKNKKFVGEILGGHPLFGPTTDFKNQNIILCSGREGKYSSWYRKFLKNLGLKIIEMSSKEHDRQMAVIQCLTHFSNVSLGYALSKLNYDLNKGEKIATPVYKLRLYGVGRILAQDPVLYADIQTFNPFAEEVSRIYLESVRELNESISKGGEEKFVEIFQKSQKYLGDFTKKSMRETDKLIKIMK